MILKNEKAVSVMLGFVPGQIDLMVATPLSFIFKQLYSRFPDAERNMGFYESYLITGINGKKILLVKTAQGVQCQDIFWPFQNICILFIGYAGGISDRIRLGAIYGVEFAMHPSVYNKTIHLMRKKNEETGFSSMQQWLFLRNSGDSEFFFPDNSIKAGCSLAMIGEVADTFCNNARQYCCDIVDMEISYCANICLENRNIFEAFVLITDLPSKINFWELSINDQNVVSEGNKTLVSVVIEYIKEEVLGE